MHSIKKDTLQKLGVKPLNSNVTQLIEKRNLLRGLFLLLSFTWLLIIGTILYLKGDEWLPTVLCVLFLSLIATSIFIFKIKKLSKQISLGIEAV